jgi:beta-lactam-binding protein with PASTA domain
MTTVLLILAVLAGVAGVTFFLMKTGKIEDKDGNNIPDVIDNKIAEAKEVVEEVKVTAKRVKEEAQDVVKAVKEVGVQANQVVKTAKSAEPRRGRKPKK